MRRLVCPGRPLEVGGVMEMAGGLVQQQDRTLPACDKATGEPRRQDGSVDVQGMREQAQHGRERMVVYKERAVWGRGDPEIKPSRWGWGEEIGAQCRGCEGGGRKERLSPAVQDGGGEGEIFCPPQGGRD
ncbi:hypothetical protein chiPu_0008222 [Chiloscyllium punctatum]|uniref:Uncharacterized protein n=1 Tax=Chiloscyllium punctatum TaxID=137246 RepID=A0A401SHG0_CHIPU|nr:hypothetical protein [Chiloscyllium punctatum]